MWGVAVWLYDVCVYRLGKAGREETQTEVLIKRRMLDGSLEDRICPDQFPVCVPSSVRARRALPFFAPMVVGGIIL